MSKKLKKNAFSLRFIQTKMIKVLQIVQTIVHKQQSFKMYTLFICLLLETQKNLLPKSFIPLFLGLY